MPISGTTKAPTISLLNKGRLGAMRLGYYSPLTLLVRVNSAAVVVDLYSAKTLLNSNDQPSTVSLDLIGGSPVVGQSLEVWIGSTGAKQLFGGTITRAALAYDRLDDRTVWHVTATDWSHLLNRMLVSQSWTSTSASTIAAALISTYTSGFTSTNVQSGLATVDTFVVTMASDATVLSVLTRLANRIGAIWYIDADKDLHFFVGTDPSTITAPLAINATTTHYRKFRYDKDLSQIRTRVFVEGLGSTVLAPCAIGETIIPVADSSMFAAAGGSAKIEHQRLTYAGLIMGNDGSTTVQADAPGQPSVTLNTNQNGNLSVGIYKYRVTFVAGTEGPGGPVSANLAIASVSAPSMTITLADNGAGNLAKGDYRWEVTFTNANGETLPSSSTGEWNVTAVANPTAEPNLNATTGGSLTPSSTYRYSLTFVDAVGETTGGSVSAPVTLGAAQNAVDLTSIQVSSDSRVTARKLYRTVAGGSQFKLLATINDNSTTTYSDVIADGSLGANIPTTNTTGSGKVQLSNIPLGLTGTTGRKLYRTDKTGIGTYKLLTTIANNTTTTYEDNTADAGLGAAAPTVSTADGGKIDVSSIDVGPSGTTDRKVYRTEAGGATYKLLTTIADNTTTTYADNIADGSLGATLASTTGVSAGDTLMRVADCAKFEATGGWVETSGQFVRYTGRSASSGVGNLTGIPASGDGAIVTNINNGSAILSSPALTGVPASGTGAITTALIRGDEVYLQVQRDDATAQTALAALEGGNGIHEHFIQDRRLSIAGAQARGDAELTLYKNPLEIVRYVTTDLRATPGQQVVVDMTTAWGVAGTFRIAKAEVAYQPGDTRPMFTVETTSQLRTLYDLLRTLQRAS